MQNLKTTKLKTGLLILLILCVINNITAQIAGNWTEIGPPYDPSGTINYSGGGTGRVQCIAFDPVDPANIFYVSSPWGGLFKTTDAGANWVNLNTDNLPVSGVAYVVVHPTNPNIIYIAIGDGDDFAFQPSTGVYKSTDGGTSWNITGLSFNFNDDKHITKLIINPNDPDILFAATTDGIYRTLDAGSSWTLVLNQSYAFRGLEFEPGTPSTIIASGNDIIKSTDGGNTWVSMTGSSTGLNYTTDLPGETILGIHIGVTPANSAVIYASIITDINFHLYRYDGTIWTKKATPPGLLSRTIVNFVELYIDVGNNSFNLLPRSIFCKCFIIGVSPAYFVIFVPVNENFMHFVWNFDFLII